MSASLHFRRYDRSGWFHHHQDVQVVVPVRGVLEIEIGGRGGRVEQGRVAVIAPGTDHDQAADGDNRFLLLHCPDTLLGQARLEQLQQRPFLPTGPRLRRLATFLDRQCAGQDPVPEVLLHHCLPGLLAGLGADPAPLQRLQQLCQTLHARLGEPWTVERMAARAGVGPSRLHALFREAFDRSPQQWLAAAHLQRACDQLATTSLPIAQLAIETGWSDQTALTRAMKRATGQTPAAWRRQRQARGPAAGAA